MKNLLLVIVVFLASVQVNAQEMSPYFLEGAWVNEEAVITFERLDNDDLQIKYYSNLSKVNVEIVSYTMDEKNLYIRTYYKPNDFSAIIKLIIVNEDTIVADYESDNSDQTIFKKLN